MKKIIVIILVAIVIIMVGYRIATHGTAEQAQSIAQIQKEQGVPVETADAVITTLDRRLNLSGTVEGITQADAHAQIMEEIAEINVSVGQYVEKGAPIARLSSENPQVPYQQALLAKQDAEKELERMKSLFETGAISQQILDKTQLGYEIAAANLAQAEEALNITAPISGIVTDIFFFKGQTPPPGAIVAKVAQLDKIKVKVDASSLYRSDIKTGQKAVIFSATDESHKKDGKIQSVGLSSDPENRNFTVYITAENKDRYFQPGMSVECQLIVEKWENVLVIPYDAVFKENGDTYVYIIDQTAKLVKVTLGYNAGNMVEVKSGLGAGQKVVINGQNNLNDGDTVLLINNNDK